MSLPPSRPPHEAWSASSSFGRNTSSTNYGSRRLTAIEPFRHPQVERMDVSQVHVHRHEPHRLRNSKFMGGFDRIDGVGASIGERYFTQGNGRRSLKRSAASTGPGKS